MSGTAVISGTMILYTPLLDDSGTDVFTYTATDGISQDTAVVTVSIDYLKIYLPAILKGD